MHAGDGGTAHAYRQVEHLAARMPMCMTKSWSFNDHLRWPKTHVTPITVLLRQLGGIYSRALNEHLSARAIMHGIAPLGFVRPVLTKQGLLPRVDQGPARALTAHSTLFTVPRAGRESLCSVQQQLQATAPLQWVVCSAASQLLSGLAADCHALAHGSATAAARVLNQLVMHHLDACSLPLQAHEPGLPAAAAAPAPARAWQTCAGSTSSNATSTSTGNATSTSTSTSSVFRALDMLALIKPGLPWWRKLCIAFSSLWPQIQLLLQAAVKGLATMSSELPGHPALVQLAAGILLSPAVLCSHKPLPHQEQGRVAGSMKDANWAMNDLEGSATSASLAELAGKEPQQHLPNIARSSADAVAHASAGQGAQEGSVHACNPLAQQAILGITQAFCAPLLQRPGAMHTYNGTILKEVLSSLSRSRTALFADSKVLASLLGNMIVHISSLASAEQPGVRKTAALSHSFKKEMGIESETGRGASHRLAWLEAASQMLASSTLDSSTSGVLRQLPPSACGASDIPPSAAAASSQQLRHAAGHGQRWITTKGHGGSSLTELIAACLGAMQHVQQDAKQHAQLLLREAQGRWPEDAALHGDAVHALYCMCWGILSSCMTLLGGQEGLAQQYLQSVVLQGSLPAPARLGLLLAACRAGIHPPHALWDATVTHTVACICMESWHQAEQASMTHGSALLPGAAQHAHVLQMQQGVARVAACAACVPPCMEALVDAGKARICFTLLV